MKENVRNMLELSAIHVPNQQPNFGSYRTVEHRYGWMVFTSDNPNWLQSCPTWLKPIMEEANKQGCVVINFDEGAPENDRLTKFSW